MKYGLKETTIKSIKNVFTQNPKIDQVILYGSRAKGNYKNGSDIDLTLLGNELSMQDLYKVLSELDELNLPYSFDVSIHSFLNNKELLEHISTRGQILYKK